MRTQLPLTLFAAALTCSLFTASAQAQRARVFVASYGNDSNPCTFGSPCKTFQQAVNVVAAGGEVTAIDSAGFGPINITKAVTITSPDGVESGIVPVAGGDAIEINAGPSDVIVLRGLTLNGAGGYNGIVFISGGGLTVTNCVVQNFAHSGDNAYTGNGIVFRPTSGSINFVITNSVVSNNGYVGIYYLPPSGSASANGVIDHVVATANYDGITVDTGLTSGTTVVAISNSIANANVFDGLYARTVSSPLVYSIDNVSVFGNTFIGIAAYNTPKVLLGRSVITGNVTGLLNNTSQNTFYTYNDNRINENGTDIGGTTPSLNTSLTLQ
jgi:hypothetical protein